MDYMDFFGCRASVADVLQSCVERCCTAVLLMCCSLYKLLFESIYEYQKKEKALHEQNNFEKQLKEKELTKHAHIAAVVAIVLRALIDICKNRKCGLFGKGGLIMFDVTSANVQYHLSDVPVVLFLGVIGGMLGSFYNYILQKVLKINSLVNDYCGWSELWVLPWNFAGIIYKSQPRPLCCAGVCFSSRWIYENE